MKKLFLSIAMLGVTAHAQVNLNTTIPAPQVKGIVQPVNGGLGLDTSAVTGCAKVTGGTWTVNNTNCTSGSGSGTVNAATVNQVAVYGATGNVVSGDPALTDTFSLLTYTGPTGLQISTTIPATSSTFANSPPFTICGNYWNGTVSTPDCWAWQTGFSSVSGFTNPPDTLLLSHTGTSGSLGISLPGPLRTQGGINAIGGLQVTPLLTATSGANYPSPAIGGEASFWNGTIGAADIWSSSVILGTGTNPTTTLTFAHTGCCSVPASSGTASVSIPFPVSTSAQTVTGESANAGFAACYTTGGLMGHCTTVVGSSGGCTCVSP